jgi:SAM-dependent methyltransferase
MQDLNASAYDELPYDSVPIPQSHPDHLAALATLAGCNAPDPSRARILELGCAEGANLLPIAFYWPDTECVGVDLSRVQAEAGQRLARAAGIGNCRILHADLCELPADLGQFDYVIAHGVYSWVPPPVQEALLDACRRHLAPQGIAHVSFNVAPGWTSRQALRGVLMRAVSGIGTPAGQVEAARRELDRLAQCFAESELRAHPDLPDEIAFLHDASPAYLFHEYLAAHNAPESLDRFRQRAASHGLTFLCDAGAGLCASAWGGAAFDYPAGMRFCRSLLIHPEARRRVPAALQEMSFHADVASGDELDLAAPTRQTFVGPNSQRIVVVQPRSKAALLVLAAAFPSSVGWTSVMAAAGDLLERYGTPQEESTPAFVSEWKDLMAAQAVWPGRVERHCVATAGQRPLAHALARAQAAAGLPPAGLRHRALDVDPAARHLLGLLDGKRNQDMLVREMTAWLAGGGPALNTEALADTVANHVALFARNGLLA